MQTLTPEFFRNNLTEIPIWRFHLLAGSPDPESGNRLKAGAIGDIVHALKAAYDYVVIDLGRSLSRIGLPLIESADLIALIVSTDSEYHFIDQNRLGISAIQRR